MSVLKQILCSIFIKLNLLKMLLTTRLDNINLSEKSVDCKRDTNQLVRHLVNLADSEDTFFHYCLTANTSYTLTASVIMCGTMF